MLSVSFWSIYWYKAYYNRLYIFGVTVPKIRKTHFLKQSSVLQPRPFRVWALLNHGFDFAGGGARKHFTSQAGQTERDREEKRWINRLKSVVPRGLNLMD